MRVSPVPGRCGGSFQNSPISLSLILFGVSLALVAPWLFMDFGMVREPLLANELWNAGHVPLFFLLTALWLDYRVSGRAATARRLVIEPLSIGISIGLLIETIQLFTGRDFSLRDLMLDLCGIGTALAFRLPAVSALKDVHRKAIRTGAATITFLALIPLWLAAADLGFRQHQFPVLSNFETPLETIRWVANTKTRVIKHEHSHVLEITLWPRSGYNKVSLVHFNGDWTEAGYLALDINNTSGKNRGLTIRVHDEKHMQAQQDYNDRYNGHFNLNPGWNNLVIPISDIQRAPKRRRIDISKIAEIQIFNQGLEEKWIIYIDNIRLLPKAGPTAGLRTGNTENRRLSEAVVR